MKKIIKIKGFFIENIIDIDGVSLDVFKVHQKEIKIRLGLVHRYSVEALIISHMNKCKRDFSHIFEVRILFFIT